MKRNTVRIKLLAVMALQLLLIIALSCQSITAEEVTGVHSYYSPQDSIWIRYDVAERGAIDFMFGGTQKDVSLLVSKGAVEYTYRISPGEAAVIPLNMGNGEYRLDARLYITPNQGELIWSETVPVELKNSLSPFLCSSKIVNWNGEMELAGQARAIAEGLAPREAALAILEHVGERITYTPVPLPARYIPDLDSVYASGEGMCYDYAALYAAMCRAAGIPCRLLMGYADYTEKGVYHAWNQVYIEGAWLTVDPTCYVGVFLDGPEYRITRLY